MEIFHNHDEPNYLTIVDYGPKWFTEFREMDANLRYAGWTLDLAAHWLERIVNNLFPESADERTIAMFERILCIEYDTLDVSLEERRRTVMAYWYGIGKLSRTSILQMAEEYTGCECDAWWLGKTVFVLCILDDLDKVGVRYDYRRIISILRKRLPAHLGFLIQARWKGFDIENRNEVILNKITYRFNMPWVFWGHYLDGSFLLDGNVLLDFCPEFNPARLTVRMPVETKEDFGIGITEYKNWWMLDGAYCLDGMQQMNAEMRKEVV